ncbi:hypothetical protein GCM10020220_104160 [Nonomuraea rubra]
MLAGVSTEWYTRLEKGHISGVSEEVLDAVSQALRLTQDERTYLFDLAHAARPARRTPSRRKDVQVPPRVQWLLDSMTMSAAFVRNAARTSSPTTRWPGPCSRRSSTALPPHGTATPTSPATSSSTPAPSSSTSTGTRPAVISAALLRAEAGREPHDRALRDLVGELSTLSTSSAASGPSTTCASATTAPSGCGTRRSATWS